MYSQVMICLSLGFVFAGGRATAADDPFVGKWKFNSAQSKVTGGLQVIQDLGGNKYKFTSGAQSWTVWVNGGDQPSGFGDTVSWKETGPNTWQVVHKMDGNVTRSATLKISEDEGTMTRNTNGTRPDGSSYAMDFKAKRVSGTKGLAGTWEIVTLKMDSYGELDIEPYDGDGLSFVTPSEKERQDMKFDGNYYPDRGPNVPPGSTSSAKRVNARTIEWTDKFKNEVIDHQELKISEDGKTLTAVIKYTGRKSPQVVVYDRQ